MTIQELREKRAKAWDTALDSRHHFCYHAIKVLSRVAA